MEYIAYLHKDKNSDYGVSFPDFPGCITAGRTLDEAARRAQEALSFHIQGMIEDGEPVPEPSNLDEVAKDAAKHGAIAFMVTDADGCIGGLDRAIVANVSTRSPS